MLWNVAQYGFLLRDVWQVPIHLVNRSCSVFVERRDDVYGPEMAEQGPQKQFRWASQKPGRRPKRGFLDVWPLPQTAHLYYFTGIVLWTRLMPTGLDTATKTLSLL